MTRYICRLFLIVTFSICTTEASSAAFDERLWEKYAEIQTGYNAGAGGLSAVYLEPHTTGNLASKRPFSDLRVITAKKEEIPYHIFARRPEHRSDELPAKLLNLSVKENGDTWFELLVDGRHTDVNGIEIVTGNTGFSRQVKVSGSNDGKAWNMLRSDGMIFDMATGEKIRHTRISFPASGYRRLAIEIVNNGAAPLEISSVRTLRESEVKAQVYTISGTVVKPEAMNSGRENSLIVRMAYTFPLDRLVIETPDRNFRRSVEVQVKRADGNWERLANGTIFSFNTATVHESQLSIEIPETAASEFRLVFSNLDSPLIPVTAVHGEGYRRLMVFKQPAGSKLYLFWGNPLADPPLYDLDGVVVRHRIDELPVSHIWQPRTNTKFAGNSARLPWTERYRYLLYAVVTAVIAGLLLLQYRIFRQASEQKDAQTGMNQ